MNNINGNQSIILMSNNHYALEGVKHLIAQSHNQINIAGSVDNYQELANVLCKRQVDMVMIIECSQITAGVDIFKYISELKIRHPKVLLSLHSSQPTSLSLLADYIDIYFSLDEPVEKWREHLLALVKTKMIFPDINKKQVYLSPLEWLILKEIRQGKKNQLIADTNNLSYRKVSALKNRAKRKLGLRSNTDLLLFLAS